MLLRPKLLALFCCLVVLAGLGSVARAETFHNPRRIPLPVDPSSLATGDLNGDGRTDIVWTELPPFPGTARLHVLLAGANGQYTSAPDLFLPFAPTLVHCIIQDVTGDKRNDLVCVAPSNNYTDVYLLTYAGNGDGTFAPPVQTRVSTQVVFSTPILKAAGDLNGDGLPDVLLANAYYSAAQPYLSDGHGGFTAATAFNGSFNYSSPVLTDLNGDGKLDVLWPTGPRVNLGHGDGTFSTTATAYDAGYAAVCAFGDVDHDGHLDAVCGFLGGSGNINGTTHLSVLHGNADGSFNTAQPLCTRTFGNGDNQDDGEGTFLNPVLVADLNGDGYADIVAVSGDGYCVLLGGPNLTWGDPKQFAAASWRSTNGIWAIYGTSIADMNGDGLPDIVAVGPNGIYITYAQRDGTLSSAPEPEVGQVTTSATLADVNGDGNLDIVSAGDTALKLSLGRGDGTFSPPQAITSTGNFGRANYAPGRVISGDFNGDGKQDLLATGSVAAYTTQNYILFGHGDGSFDAPLPTTIPVFPSQVADLNGDGRSDLVQIQNGATTTNALVVSLSRGDGTFTTISTPLPAEMQPNNVFFYADVGPALGDFRHTGRLDAAVAAQSNAYLLRGHGDGSFDATGTTLPIPDLPSLNKVQVVTLTSADFDGDGNLDLAVLSTYGNGTYNVSTPTSAVWIFYGKGDGTFSSAVLAGTFNRNTIDMHAGDLDGDGLADIVLVSNSVYQDNGVLIIHALPNRTWGPESDYTGGNGLSPFWIADLNHDGRNDLLFSNAGVLNYSSSSVAVLLNEPNAVVTGTLTVSPEPSIVGDTIQITATLFPSPAGPSLAGKVTFAIDGVPAGAAALNNNVAQLPYTFPRLYAGTHTVTATWPGDGTYPPVTISATHVINPIPLAVALTASPSTVNVGAPVKLSTLFTNSAPPNFGGYQYGGSLTFYDGTTPVAQQVVSAAGFSSSVASLSAGTHTLKAVYSGDPQFAAATSNTVTVTVLGQPSFATLAVSPNPSTYGTPVTARVTVNPASPLATGTVAFVLDGAPSSTLPLANGAASLTLNQLSAGAHTVSCTYSGDAIYAASSCSTVPFTITPAPSALTLTSSANPAPAFTSITYTAHLKLNGQPAVAASLLAIIPGVNSWRLVTDSSGNATFSIATLAPGRYLPNVGLVDNNYLPVVNYQPAFAQLVQDVTATPTVLTLFSTPNPSSVGQNVTFTTGVTAGNGGIPIGTVNFAEGLSVLASVPVDATGHASFSTSTLPAGTHSITASYAATAAFAASSATVQQVVNVSSFTLALSPATLSLRASAAGTTTVQLTSIGGFSGPLKLAAGPLPPYATASFSASTVTLTAGGSGSSTLGLQTMALSALQPHASPFGRGRAEVLAASLSTLAGLALLPVARRRRRQVARALLLTLVAVAVTSTTGCITSFYMRHTVAPGAYTVPITATDANGNSRTAILTVNVTP